MHRRGLDELRQGGEGRRDLGLRGLVAGPDHRDDGAGRRRTASGPSPTGRSPRPARCSAASTSSTCRTSTSRWTGRPAAPVRAAADRSWCGRSPTSGSDLDGRGRAPTEPVDASVEAVFREERGRLLAALVRRFGDLDLAEEVTSEAIEAALVHWPVDGVPTRPGAWLLTTARRRAVDRLRRDQVYAARLAVLQVGGRPGRARPARRRGRRPARRAAAALLHLRASGPRRPRTAAR